MENFKIWQTNYTGGATWVRKNQKLKRKSVACKKRRLQTALKILKNKKVGIAPTNDIDIIT